MIKMLNIFWLVGFLKNRVFNIQRMIIFYIKHCSRVYKIFIKQRIARIKLDIFNFSNI